MGRPNGTSRDAAGEGLAECRLYGFHRRLCSGSLTHFQRPLADSTFPPNGAAQGRRRLTNRMIIMPNNPTALSNPSSSRLLSIDALRGFDMFWIVGGEELFKAWAHWADWSHKDLVD